MSISTFTPTISTIEDGSLTSTSADSSNGTSWSAIRNVNVASEINYSLQNDIFLRITAGLVSNQWTVLQKSIFLFDTSSIPDTDYISSGTLALRGYSKIDQLSLGSTYKIDLVSSNPASNNVFISADWNTFGTIKLNSNDVNYDNWDISNYNNFILNSTGLSLISKNGVTKFGIRDYFDRIDSPPTWISGQSTRIYGYFVNYGDYTNYSPKLIITHSPVNPIIQRKRNLQLGTIYHIKS